VLASHAVLLMLIYCLFCIYLFFVSEVLEITDGADKQLRLEKELADISEIWENTFLEFNSFKNRGEVILRGDIVNEIIEKLEESQANINQVRNLF
jgi:dynein heavy chain